MWLYRKVKLTPELEEFNWILSKSAPSDKYLAKFDPQTSPVSTGSAYVNVFGSALRKVLSDQRVAGNILKDIWRKLPWEYLNLCENYYRRKLNRGGHEPEPFPDSEDEDEDNGLYGEVDIVRRERPHDCTHGRSVERHGAVARGLLKVNSRDEILRRWR